LEEILVIAEAGCNHNGDIDMAFQLVDVAVESGANIVKFQTFTANTLVTKYAEKAEYAKKSTNVDESQQEMQKKLELNKNEHIQLKNYCDKKGIEFLSSAFDLNSIKLLDKLDLTRFKIPSGEITNLPYLELIGSRGKPIIISTGMSTLKEVKLAINVILESGCEKNQITALHCTTEYPTPIEEVNLRAMLTLRDELEVKVGYSDHTVGTDVSVAAVSMGATIIEKHFTLNRNLTGPDHSASLEPSELKSLVKKIRNIELAMGDGIKRPAPCEIKNIPVVRKSVVAKDSIKKGDLFTNENLTVKRPGQGVSPMKWKKIVGKRSNKDYLPDELILL